MAALEVIGMVCIVAGAGLVAWTRRQRQKDAPLVSGTGEADDSHVKREGSRRRVVGLAIGLLAIGLGLLVIGFVAATVGKLQERQQRCDSWCKDQGFLESGSIQYRDKTGSLPECVCVGHATGAPMPRIYVHELMD